MPNGCNDPTPRQNPARGAPHTCSPHAELAAKAPVADRAHDYQPAEHARPDTCTVRGRKPPSMPPRPHGPRRDPQDSIHARPFAGAAPLRTGSAILIVGLVSAIVSAAQSAGPSPRVATPQRPSFSSDTATTAPGTIELEFGGDVTGQEFGLPTGVKFTPDVQAWILRGTEFSVNFDAIKVRERQDFDETSAFEVTDISVRRTFYQQGGFALAVKPELLFTHGGPVRDDRLGLRLIGTYSFGLNTILGNVVWNAALRSSSRSARQQWDWIGGYTRTLAGKGVGNRFDLFAEFRYQAPRGSENSFDLIQGVHFWARPDLVLDFAVQQEGLGTRSGVDVRFLGGITVNVGRIQR